MMGGGNEMYPDASASEVEGPVADVCEREPSSNVCADEPCLRWTAEEKGARPRTTGT